MDYLGVSYDAGKDRWQAVRCPFHDDGHKSASLSLDKEWFKCHACDANGDIVNLVSYERGVDFTEAVEWITETFLAE